MSDAKAAKDTPLPEPVQEAIEADDKAARRGKLGWLGLTVAILFGLFYAYDLFEAISNTIGVVTQYGEVNRLNEVIGRPLIAVPWLILVIDLVIPIVVYSAAFIIGFRQNLISKVLVFILGLAVAAALSLSVETGFILLFP
ncbi:hypothetical protein BH09ACT3_BH09ACT3_07660 [soil metagenome]